MGSSVFHGGFSTLIAIGILGFAKLYASVIFFKTWIFIISIGMLNGMVLLPVLLAICGPNDDHQSAKENPVEGSSTDAGEKASAAIASSLPTEKQET